MSRSVRLSAATDHITEASPHAVTVMFPIAGQTPMPSPEAWRVRLDANRGTNSSETDAELWPELRRRFREISLRTRSLLEAPLESPALQNLADQSLRLSQLAFAELNRFDLEPNSTAPFAEVAELLEDDRRLLDAISAQRRLIAELHTAAESLHAWTEELVHGGGTAKRWLTWSEEFRSSVNQRAGSDALLPLAGVRLDESLHRAGWSQPGWYVQAFGSARLAAALGEALLDGDPEGQRRLTAAALVQDTGLWNLESRLVRSERSKQQLARQHPAIGAAMLAGISGCPSEIVSLVGAHHERMDGSGEPRRLTGRRLAQRARIFGLIARFCEIAYSPECHAEAESHVETVSLIAGLQIWREARRGAFPMELAQTFLNAIEPGLTDRLIAMPANRSQLFVDARHPLPQPHAPVEATSPPHVAAHPIPEPMFLRRQRGGGRRLSSSVDSSGNFVKAVR